MLKKYTFYIGWLISLSTVAVSNTAIGQAASQNKYTPPSSDPQHLTVTESGMFFSAEDGVHGRELWILDEPYGYPKMVSNISKGELSTEFEDFMAFGKYLLLTKVIGQMKELWYSDGTEKGTDRISIYQVEPGVGYLYPLFVMKNSFYFVVKNNQDDHQIWTLSHEDLVPTPLFPRGETPYVIPKTGSLFKEGNDFFVFASATNIHTNVYKPSLWRSDGTAVGTFELISLEQTSGEMYVTDSMVLFSALENSELGWELYVSDGTREGTTLLKDIWVGPKSSSPGQFMSPEGQKGVYFFCQ